MKKENEMTVSEMAKLGGHARAKKLSPKRRSEIAKLGALAREKNKAKKKGE